MDEVESLEERVRSFSHDEPAQFRAWFLGFDWTTWNEQTEQDARTGRLDALAGQALRDHAAGKTTGIATAS